MEIFLTRDIYILTFYNKRRMLNVSFAVSTTLLNQKERKYFRKWSTIYQSRGTGRRTT